MGLSSSRGGLKRSGSYASGFLKMWGRRWLKVGLAATMWPWGREWGREGEGVGLGWSKHQQQWCSC